MDEFVIVPDSVNAKNLNRLTNDYCTILEQRTLEICDIAQAMLDYAINLRQRGVETNEILSLLLTGFSLGEYPVSDLISAENKMFVYSSLSLIEGFDRVALCREFVRIARESEFPIAERDFLPTGEREESVVYVKNALSDEAYTVFAEGFSKPRVAYSVSIRDSVLAVSSGENGYCLLPFEENGGVRLHTVAELIYRNDLKINGVTPVFGLDGNAELKYALLSKYFTVPRRGEDDERYLELRLGEDSFSHLAQLLSSLPLFGMSLYRIDTVSFFSDGEGERFIDLLIREENGSFVDLFVYLALFVSDFTPVGMYLNLE